MSKDFKEAFLNKKAFIAYLMAGDPDIELTREYILTLDKAGADIIELGIPFSDPIAEGRVIQNASLRGLRSNTTLDDVFHISRTTVKEIKASLVLMSYINPILNYGYDEFFMQCRVCGIRGVIIPDLPFEERMEIDRFRKKHGVFQIFLLAPTSSEERIISVASEANGWIYLVSSMGVTGTRNQIDDGAEKICALIRKYTSVPIAVGFGIHSRTQADNVRRYADGVIVGSAIVKIIEEHPLTATPYLTKYVHDLCHL
ncbi:MAG: tryptophan synthase subunit alpha [Christensenellaceae bacterium]|jgi:tryptophan synthase alpha chain|nr:tryptophan synthase subunit alpha [Christensenellaceae bacterium]